MANDQTTDVAFASSLWSVVREARRAGLSDETIRKELRSLYECQWPVKRDPTAPQLPQWFLARTLLGCGPNSDLNRRIIYHNSRAVMTLNQRMSEWHPDDDKALNALCDYLNRLEKA